MRRHLTALAVAAFVLVHALPAQGAGFTLGQVRSYPFPTELTAAATGNRIAWAVNEQGRRNIYVAAGPDFTPRRLTDYLVDDGQELSSVALSPDGKFVIYVRGGDHGANWGDDDPVNVLTSPVPPKVQIWSVAFEDGEPKAIGEGEQPVMSPRENRIAFTRGGQIWTALVGEDGSAPAKPLFNVRGTNGDPQWSPDGSRLAFVCNRGDHAFVGIYTNDSTPVLWLEPTFARDRSPRWSPDGTAIAFVRLAAAGGAPDSILVRRPVPWAIWTVDAGTGRGRQLWKSPETLRGSPPSTHGGTNLHWAAGRIVFLSYQDGWPHLYSIPETGGDALLLTRGDYMAEHIQLSPDGRWLVFAANTGGGRDPLDLHRRHVVRVPVDRASAEVVTPGAGNEWAPVVTGDGQTLVYLAATAQQPPLPTVRSLAGGQARQLGKSLIPADFPAAQLVTPRAVSFKAADGVTVWGQLFERSGGGGGAARKAAVIFVHGGPPRQMLLGWHYSDYYSNAYATNQYLASRGFVVLSVNYRLGIGYGYEFHVPPDGGARGASEYRDVQAAAQYLRSLPQVDAARIGIYGGSYGGYLTALALARNSDLFAAGVDIHGVHDWTTERARGMLNRDRYEEAPDLERALDVAFRSSPVADVATWRSPVLLIHGDDDRNVRFSQSTDLVQRLGKRKVPFETLVIPDDTHHFLRYAHIMTVDSAAVEFLERKLKGGESGPRAESSSRRQ